MTDLLREKSLTFVVPGAVMFKEGPVKTVLGKSQNGSDDDDAYQKWKTAARIWALFSIDSKTFPLKGACKVEARIHYRGTRPGFTECIESIGDCFRGILWSDVEQIASWGGSKVIKDNVDPRLEMVIRW